MLTETKQFLSLSMFTPMMMCSHSSMMNTILFLTAATVSCFVVTKAWQHQHQQHQQQQHQHQHQHQQQQQPVHGGGKAKDNNQQATVTDNYANSEKKQVMISLAFLGNSMLYYNDCPRLVERLLLESGDGGGGGVIVVHQDSCLRGGATLSSLWIKGNGMQEKFRTSQAKKEKGDKDNGDGVDDNDDEYEYDIGAPTVTELIQNQQAWWKQQEEEEECTTDRTTSSSNIQKEAFIIINDHTQNPAREATRQESLQILKSSYAPLIFNSSSSAVVPVVIFIQTPAYKLVNMRHSEDLGSFEEFTDRVATGVAQYVHLMQQERDSFIRQQHQCDDDDDDDDEDTIKGEDSSSNNDNDDDAYCRVAPVGQAYQWLHETNLTLWEKLYSWDNFHPSPHGTWLQACILYCAMMKRPVPETLPMLQQVSNATWWKSWSRVMQPPDEGPLPLPTLQEALELLRVASIVCGVK